MHTFSASLVLSFIFSICEGQHDNTCNVFPKDLYIEEGSTAEIFCQTSCENEKIFWRLNSGPIDENESVIINSTHTVLSLKNVTLSSATLECHSSKTQQILGGTIITTYSKPRNISCIWHYKDQESSVTPQLLTCKWEHHTSPSVKINYSVLGGNSLSSTHSEICSSHVTTCTSTDVHTSDVEVLRTMLADNITVRIRAKTDKWEVYSDPYEFSPTNILKPNAPMVAVDVTSDHLLVKCKATFMLPKWHCQVKYYKASLSNEETPKFLNCHGCSSFVIKDVESCSNYIVLGRCAYKEAPWSDWSPEMTVRTKLNMSHIRLRLWRKVTEVRKNGNRKVQVMWMNIAKTCEETFNYTIRMTYNADNPGGRDAYILCGSSPCDIEVDQNSHRINLIVSRDDIVYAEDSVYVPAIKEVKNPPRVDDIQTSTREGVILVSWKAPEQPFSGYYTIDWTHNGNEYNWMETSFTNATLSDLHDKMPYNITVTPLLDDRKTGYSTEALQICSTVGAPGKVTIRDFQPYDKSAFVSWDAESQDPCSGEVTHYIIFYQTQAPKQRQLNLTVDGRKRNVVLNDLTPDTTYAIYVKAIAHTGNTTSIERFFTTTKFDPRLFTTVIVSGGVVMILVLSLGLCCVIQWKKYLEKPLPNPRFSSMAVWQTHQKTVSHLPFTKPSESLCDRVYTEEAPAVTPPSSPADHNGHVVSDQRVEYSKPIISLMAEVKPAEPVETQLLPSSEESTAFLSTQSSPVNPYRSQTSVKAKVPRTTKQSRRDLNKQHEKTSLKTIYVSLDMYEQDTK